MTEEKEEDPKIFGVPVAYVAILAIMGALYLFDANFKSRAGDLDPKLVEVLERLSGIEQQIRYIDTKIDRDNGGVDARVRSLEDWRINHEREHGNSNR